MKLWLIFVCFAAHLSFSCDSKVKLDIYYESLCPDSVRFISAQLQPLYASFKQHLDITFIPHGKSSSYRSPSGTVEFECQHGPDECFGNKVQDCMLRRFPDQDMQVAYVSCQMQSLAARTNTFRDHRLCVEQFGVSYNEILQCVASPEATQQQLYYESITRQVLQHTNWVPSVTFNGQITQYSAMGKSGVPNLIDVLCQYCNNNNPACSQSG